MTGEANLTVQGAGGGGGDSHTPVESPNSLVSKTTARVLFLTSDGEVGGLTDQANKLKSVYFNNVPVMNADGSKNFANVALDERYGLPSQAVMPGYVSAASTFTVASKVTTATPVTYTTSTSAPDAVRVTIRFPALFAQQSNGDTTGTEVQFEIHRRLGAGAFSLVRTVTKNDKCNSPADADYLIERPAGAGTWSVKVVRVTADNAVSTVANDIYFQTAAELQYAQLPYNNRAYIGLTVTAEATGSTFPLVSFDTTGLKVKVPSNYNATTRVYTGSWNGLFSGTKVVCSNPAWVLYDLLTSTTHGMGLAESDIDQYSFYDAAVYNDGSVPALVSGAISGTEPRYTFNYQLMAQESAWTTIQNIAASMGAAVYTSGNRVKLVQDRPTSFSRVITNSNVIEGLFEYSSSQKNSRTSACIVYWNNPNENWLSVPCYYEDSAGTARYGLNTKEVTGLGITTEGQAMRLAKWHVDTSLNNTDAVIFKVGFANAGLEPGEVVKLMDTDYAAVMNEAKVVSSTATSVTLDREITVAVGNTFDVAGADGATLYTRTITSAGTSATVGFSGAALDIAAGADFVLTGAVSPRLFKVTSSKEDSPGVYVVSAVEYDPNKFGRVDSTPTGITPTFQAPTQIPSAPQNLAFKETNTNTDGVIRRTLNVSWTRPASGTVKNYVLRYRRASTSWDEVTLNATSYDIQGALDGAYEVKVFPRSALDVLGPEANGTWTMSSIGGGSTLLNAPTSLQLIGGGTTFTGPDINFQWTNPSSNGTIAATLRDFEVKFIETTGSTTVRTVYVPAVAAGTTQATSYTFSMNTFDGGPRRSMQVQVRCRDAAGNVSSPATATFTNAVIATVQNIAVSSANGGVKITYTLPSESDFGGVLIWRSTTSGFTPASGNLVYDTTDNYIADMVPFGTTYYYKLAAYDSFGKPLDGAGLNISAQQSGAAASPDGIPEVATLPNPSGYSGPKIVFLTTDGQLYSYISGAWQATIPPVSGIADGAVTIAKFASGLKPVEILGSLPTTGNTAGRLVFLTGDSKLYRYNGSAFVTTVPSTDITGTLTDSQLAAIAAAKITGTIVTSQIADAALTTAKFASGLEPITIVSVVPGTLSTKAVFNTTDGKLYRWNGSAYVASVPAADVTGTLTDSQIAALSAAKLTGTITTTQITDNAISTAKIAAGAITTAKIAADAVTANEIAANAITASELSAGAVTTAKLAAGAVTANELAANSVVAGKIAAGAITATELAAGSITASKMLVTAQGTAINDDPMFVDTSAWALWANVSLQNGTGIANAVANTYAYCATGTDQMVESQKLYPVGPGKTYRLSANLYAQAGNNRDFYIYIEFFDVSGAYITGATTGWGGSKSGYVYGGQPATGSFVRCGGQFGPGTSLAIPATARTMRIGVWFQYSGTGTSQVSCAAQDLRLEEVVTSALIVDGTIAATKLVAGSITATQIAADTITAAQIAANAITATELSAGAVTTAKIAAGAVTANEIAANTITAGKIQTGAITSTEIAANAIRTDKLLVTGQGAALNDDPNCFDQSAWTTWASQGAATVTAITDGVTGTSVLRSATGTRTINARLIPADSSKKYRLSAWVRSVGSNGLLYLRTVDYAPNETAASGGIERTWGIEAVTPPSGAWTKYTAEVSVASGRTAFTPHILLAWSGSTGYMEAQGIRLEEKASADLIVDGAIVTSKLAAGAVTANEVAANAITAGKIAAASIAGDRLQATTITGDKLVASTITGDKIAAGTVTATNIDSRNLTIKDAAGTVIFSAGVPLTSSNITPASSWLNSNVSIASNGALTGAGGGQVTITGLGYTGELNATYGAIAGSTLKDSSGASIPVDGIRNNLANVDWWVRGASIPWSPNSEYNNLIAVSPTGGDTPGSGYPSIPGPRGGADIVWYAQENAGDSGPGGGWNGGTHAPLVATKTYRFVLPVRRLSAVTGTAYWGTNNVCDLNTTSINGNPYFVASGLSNTDRWYLAVGYIFPAGSINNTHDGAGLYDCKTGAQVAGGLNFTFSAANVALGHRAYQYYAGQYAAMVFGRPMISLVDGSEPSLREYFESTAVLNTAISISGNTIVGIGAGSGTEVVNAALVPSINSAATTAVWTGVSSRPANVAALAGSEPIQNSQIAVNTTTGAISGIGSGDGTSVANNRNNFITAPGGGFFGINAPTQYGAIRIKLPSVVNAHYPMLKMTVEIYEYVSGLSCTLSIAGHTSGTGWYNVSASVIGGNVEYPVRFGHDGTNYIVWIGDPATEVWDYPQVFIKDVVVGYTHTTPDIWSTGWAITLSTAAVTNVTATVLDTYPAADWSKTARKPSTLAGINSSEGSKLSGIAAGATVGATFGTNISGQITAGNASTYIANAAIGTAQVGQLTASNIAANTITTDRLEVSAVTARSSTSNSGASYGFTSATSVNTGLVTANNVTSTGAPMLVGGVVTVSIGFTSIVARVNVLCQLFRDGVLCSTIQNNRFPAWVNGSSYQYEDFYHFNTLLPATTAGTKQFSVQVIVGFEFNNGNPATVSGTLISGFNIFTQENKV